MLSANNDIANAESLRFAKRVDPEGKRTVGVMTKIDLYEGSDRNLGRILGNEIVNLKLGFVCTSTLDFEDDRAKVAALKDKLQSLDGANFGRECLVRKLEQVLVSKMTSNFGKIKIFLSEELSRLEKQNTDSLLCSNVESLNVESKSVLLLKLINLYTEKVKKHLRGNFFQIDQELKGAAVINEILDKKFKLKVAQVQVEDSISLKDIYMTIMNTNGFQSSLFVSQRAFEILTSHMIQKLLPISVECLDLVWRELHKIFESVWIGEKEYFFNLRREILASMDSLIQERMHPARVMIEQFFEIETGYINTKHPDFLLSAKESIMSSVKESQKKRAKGKKSVYNEDLQRFGSDAQAQPQEDVSREPQVVRKDSDFSLARLSKREKNEIELIMDMLKNYFNLVKKNICDYVPKIIITLLVKKTVNDCERVLISKLYREEKYGTLFEIKTEHETKLMKMKEKIKDIREILKVLSSL